MKKSSTARRMVSGLLPVLVAAIFNPGAAQAEIEPAARELAKAVADKVGSAQTIRLTARHHLDPALGVGVKIENGPLEITVKRPNQFYTIQPAGAETRELAFDGKTLCLMHPQLKHHALEPLKAGSIDQFADRVDERFGFRPPIAELLSKDVAAQLFLYVTSARVTGKESVGWTRCERLHFEQPGMTGDLWVGVKDKLPRRYLLTFTDIAGMPTWDIRLTKWELNVPVDERLFAKRPAADSQKIRMLKSR
ncbi:MAG: hypothetical protein JWM59_3519 [Verrucomicrobiales bacterium]|nr:hypothetical protein [Verrucomicrobiales bacterium]